MTLTRRGKILRALGYLLLLVAFIASALIGVHRWHPNSLDCTPTSDGYCR